MCAFNTAMRFNLAPEKLRISFIRIENKFWRAKIKAINFTVVKPPRRISVFLKLCGLNKFPRIQDTLRIERCFYGEMKFADFL